MTSYLLTAKRWFQYFDHLVFGNDHKCFYVERFCSYRASAFKSMCCCIKMNKFIVMYLPYSYIHAEVNTNLERYFKFMKVNFLAVHFMFSFKLVTVKDFFYCKFYISNENSNVLIISSHLDVMRYGPWSKDLGNKHRENLKYNRTPVLMTMK